MQPHEIINQFFDLNLPCPKEIPLCEQIRSSFFTELKRLENTPGCSSCAKSRLKSRFVESLLKEIVVQNKDENK